MRQARHSCARSSAVAFHPRRSWRSWSEAIHCPSWRDAGGGTSRYATWRNSKRCRWPRVGSGAPSSSRNLNDRVIRFGLWRSFTTHWPAMASCWRRSHRSTTRTEACRSSGGGRGAEITDMTSTVTRSNQRCFEAGSRRYRLPPIARTLRWRDITHAAALPLRRSGFPPGRRSDGRVRCCRSSCRCTTKSHTSTRP